MISEESVEYVLDFAVKNRSGNVWPGVAFLGTISSPIGFRKALFKNAELLEIIKYSIGRNASGGFDHLEIQDIETYYFENPSMLGNNVKIPELSDFVRKFNANFPPMVSAPNSSLVCPELPMAPVADVKVPMVAPAGSVPAFIYGEEAEIQGSVRDAKRDTTLTENKKQTGIQEQILEQMKKNNEFQEQIARNTGTIAKNTKVISRENVERIEKNMGKDYRRYWQYEIQIPSMTYEQIWKWENPGRTLEGLDAEEKKAELNPIYKSISAAKAKMRKH